MTEDELRASIKEKKAELAALEQLRDQSSALVAHLEAMKGKFGEIKEGTAGELWRRGLPRGGGEAGVEWTTVGRVEGWAVAATALPPPVLYASATPQWPPMCSLAGVNSLLLWRPETRTG